MCNRSLRSSIAQVLPLTSINNTPADRNSQRRKATLTVTPAAASRAYGAANPTFTGSITGLAGADSITATYASTATATTTAGTYSTGTNAVTSTLLDPGSRLGNYTLTQNLGALTITQVTTALTWSTPASIAYGTTLSSTQLNATSGGVAGNFAYSPAFGTVLSAGNQTLSVTFTPTDTTDYNSATAAAKITVSQAAALAVVYEQRQSCACIERGNADSKSLPGEPCANWRRNLPRWNHASWFSKSN
jgi:hypothetical protein